MTHNIPKIVTKKEPKAMIDDFVEPTWNILMEKCISENTGHSLFPILEMMESRRDMGFEKHGTHLTPHNGRNNVVDSIQEQLDAVVYLTNEWREENEHLRKKQIMDTVELILLVLENTFLILKNND